MAIRTFGRNGDPPLDPLDPLGGCRGLFFALAVQIVMIVLVGALLWWLLR